MRAERGMKHDFGAVGTSGRAAGLHLHRRVSLSGPRLDPALPEPPPADG